MRRFLTLGFLLCLAVPSGVSIIGCVRNPAAKYCSVTSGYGILVTQVYSITLQPQIAGISLAYGQTAQSQSPTAVTCTGATAQVNSKNYVYSTTNNQLVDISPSGDICAGTWNRNTGGGILDYTYCNAPSQLPSTNGLPYGVAYITVTANSVTSNPVAVYVHAPVTAINLVGPSSCQSQGTIAQLDAEAYYSANGTQTLLCAPNSTSVPTCESSIGTMNFTVGTPAVATIDSTTNQITAELPGTTVITASIANSGSSAGYFSTCGPESIKLSLANGATSGSIAQGVTQNLTTTVVDTNGSTITGLPLTYQSTNQIDITTATGGAITTSFPGTASINAICEPATCNPAPINQIGLNGTGLSLSSNPVTVTVPGTASQYAWFASPGQSQYVVPIELLTGTVGSNVRLPYVPNSALMDRGGNDLYLGSPHELMVYSLASNTVSKQDTTAPGVVLAVSPSDSQLLINDQLRQVFYLYNISSGTSTTFGGMGAAASWTPDSETLYIADSAALGGYHSNTLYVYNANTGWSSCSAGSACSGNFAGAQSLAITVPSVGAYFSGSSNTVSRTWCPSGTVGGTLLYYPQGDSVSVPTSVLGATLDGAHILGATESGSNISIADIGVSIPTTECPGTGTATLSALSTNPVQNGTASVSAGPGVAVTGINQVVTGAAPTSASTGTPVGIAFVTYAASSSVSTELPYYLPSASGLGTFNALTFADSTSATPPTAPLAGAFSPDNTLFFVSTQGDNEIHYITIPTNLSTTAPSDSKQISPNLPACTPVSAGGTDAGCTYTGTGTIVPATVITVKPRSTT